MILPEIEKLKDLVRKAAREELLTDFGTTTFDYKEDGSVITPADLSMQNRLAQELQQHWPDFDILGEEMSEQQQLAVIEADSKDSDRGYWCIDPLDGTSNYTAGFPFFSVSVALIVNGQQQLGLIYDPVRDEMFTAVKGQGAYLNQSRLDHSGYNRPDNKPVIAEIDLKRLPEPLRVRLMTERIFASQRNVGSSALDWCWMAAGRYDIYLHGGQKLWDYAAGSFIMKESGGLSISLDNDVVFRGKLELRSVLACHDAGLFDYWHNWLGIN